MIENFAKFVYPVHRQLPGERWAYGVWIPAGPSIEADREYADCEFRREMAQHPEMTEDDIERAISESRCTVITLEQFLAGR